MSEISSLDTNYENIEKREAKQAKAEIDSLTIEIDSARSDKQEKAKAFYDN